MSGPILRLEGLPFRINEEEIRQFFTEAECKINRVHLIVNRDLRPSGNGYLEVESEADVKAALTLDGKCVGDSKRYVKIGELQIFSNYTTHTVVDLKPFPKTSVTEFWVLPSFESFKP